MSVGFRSAISPVSLSPGNTHDFTMPTDLSGVSAGDLLVLALGIEGQAPGSGPWVDESGSGPGTGVIGSGSGWRRACYQAPDATGSGLEIWVSIWGGGSGTITLNLLSSLNTIILLGAWSGAYAPTGHITDGALRAAVSAQVSGDDPAAPSVYAYVDEILIAAGADKLLSPGWGTPTPSGWAQESDGARAGTHGNVEAVLADKAVTVEGNSGSIPFPASESGSAHGATATLAIRPSPPAATSPLIAVEFAVSS